jgi:uncharacterized RDD family membrane protein YckC
VTNGRNVVVGLVVTTGRVGVTTGRVALFPARVVARSVLARPFRNRVEGLAESGRSAEVDVRRRIEAVAAEVLATPETEHVVEGVFAGQLPEAIARSLVEHQVVGRVAAEALASADLEREVGSAAVETERTDRLVEQVLASPALERLLADALDSRLTVDLTDKMVRSPAFRHVLYGVLSSPELRAALTDQSTSFAQEIAEGLRQRLRRLDDTAERKPRHWFRRPPQAHVSAESDLVPYAGVATRGLGLVVDAALVTMIFLTGTAVVGLVLSLVWTPEPAWLVGSVIAVAGAVVEVAYFAGFWSTTGQTPGMRLMHLRVLDDSGSVPGLARSLLRVLGLALAILLLFVGFLPALVDNRRRALQDFLAGTVVVYYEHARGGVGDPLEREADLGDQPLVERSEVLPLQAG